LKRKGAGDYAKQLAELHVRDLMKPNPLTISLTTGFSEIAEKFVATRFNYLYVTDDGRFLGAVSLHDIKSYLNAPELAKVVIAGDLLLWIHFRSCGRALRSQKRWNVSVTMTENVCLSCRRTDIWSDPSPRPM
jgi:CBS domain